MNFQPSGIFNGVGSFANFSRVFCFLSREGKRPVEALPLININRLLRRLSLAPIAVEIRNAR